MPKNLDTAKTFYLMAAQSSHAMANYWLGVIYHHQGELSKAYKSFKSIAASNPSAAYRAYWILKARKDLDPEVDAERYLQDAVQQEHLAAQKTLAMRYISGREGLSKMLFGLILLVKMVFNAYRIAQSGETMKHK